MSNRCFSYLLIQKADFIGEWTLYCTSKPPRLTSCSLGSLALIENLYSLHRNPVAKERKKNLTNLTTKTSTEPLIGSKHDLSVCDDSGPCKKNELIEMPFGCGLKWAHVLDGGPDPHGQGHLWGRWRRDFPARHRAPSPVAVTLDFAAGCRPASSVPIGQPQKQSSVALNFPNDEISPPLDVASRQHSLTSCYC